MALIELTCPNCSASLPPREDSGRYRCDYCETHFEAATPRATAATPQRIDIETGAPARAGGSAIAVAIIIALLGGIGAIVAAIVAKASEDPGALLPALANLPHVPPAPGASGTTAAKRVLWDDVGGRPLPALLSGREVVIGRVRARPSDELFVSAFDARSLEPTYQLGPFGTYSDGYRHTFFSVKGEHIAVSTYRAELKVYSLVDGEAVRTHTLTDRIEYICDAGEATEVWVQVADERHLMIDLATGEVREAARPRECAGSRHEALRRLETLNATQAPSVDGFEAMRVQTEGSVAVAAGHKSPGTALPIILGFDPANQKVRWQKAPYAVDQHQVRERSNEFDALVGGRYFASYGTGSDRWRLAAFDAETGEGLWDVELSDIFAVDALDGVVASSSSVFVVRTSSLDIYDARDGTLVGAIGAETYE